jgi:hypothetical protein
VVGLIETESHDPPEAVDGVDVKFSAAPVEEETKTVALTGVPLPNPLSGTVDAAIKAGGVVVELTPVGGADCARASPIARQAANVTIQTAHR